MGATHADSVEIAPGRHGESGGLKSPAAWHHDPDGGMGLVITT